MDVSEIQTTSGNCRVSQVTRIRSDLDECMETNFDDSSILVSHVLLTMELASADTIVALLFFPQVFTLVVNADVTFNGTARRNSGIGRGCTANDWATQRASI
jgi:hypothetical protein